MAGLPKFKYSTVVQDPRKEGEESITVKKDLAAIPAKYGSMVDNDHERLLRQDGETSLAELKEFHHNVLRAQNVPEEDFKKQCANMDLSVDGVQEAPKAKRKLLIVSIRFGTAIYIKKVFNPLVGVTIARPSVDEVLR